VGEPEVVVLELVGAVVFVNPLASAIWIPILSTSGVGKGPFARRAANVSPSISSITR